jgi:hypothetical protein
MLPFYVGLGTLLASVDTSTPLQIYDRKLNTDFSKHIKSKKKTSTVPMQERNATLLIRIFSAVEKNSSKGFSISASFAPVPTGI